MSQVQKFTIIGVQPSKGVFDDPKTGQSINYDSTNFHCITPNSKGVGSKEVIHKMAGSINYNRFKDLALPLEANFEFELEFNGKFPKTKLINVEIL